MASRNTIILIIITFLLIVAFLYNYSLSAQVESTQHEFNQFRQNSMQMIAINRDKTTIDKVLNHAILRRANIKKSSRNNETVVTLYKQGSSKIAPNIFSEQFLNSSLTIKQFTIDDAKVEVIIKK
jgi:hypothetical protein